MTDELVQRHVEQLRMTGGDLADLCQPLADAIEALTAARDAAYGNGYRDAETDIMSSLGKSNAFLHSQYANAAVLVRELTAERDRLREALKELLEVSRRAVRLSVEHDNFKLNAMEPMERAILLSRAALKGETP